MIRIIGKYVYTHMSLYIHAVYGLIGIILAAG